MRIDKMSSKIAPCDKDAIVCETVDDSYPETTIKKILSTHVAFKTPTFFDKLFGDVCVPQDDLLSTRGGFDVSLTELCSSGEKYIYPKKAKLGQEWFYVINTGKCSVKFRYLQTGIRAGEIQTGVLFKIILLFIKVFS
jgi:hypothetical protein